jgi:antitoxin VapB
MSYTSATPKPTVWRASWPRAPGRPITRVVVEALREKLKREQGRTTFPSLKDEIMAISRRTAALPRRTGRTADEILGYDERGLPR